MPLNVVIAGASGFLGSHLSEELRGRGHTVDRAGTPPDVRARTSRPGTRTPAPSTAT